MGGEKNPESAVKKKKKILKSYIHQPHVVGPV